MQMILHVARLYFFLIICSLAVSCQNGSPSNEVDQSSSSPDGGVPVPATIAFTLLESYPHDTAAFTQGLELLDGDLLESTGLTEKSTLRRVTIRTGKPQKIVALAKDVFAEGLTVLNDTIFQLSWQNLIFLYDAKSLKPIGTLPWSGDGWGITNDGKQLIISDGSDKLYFVEPGTLKLKQVLSVRDNYGPINNINELEMVDGFLFANRWQYEYIMKIDPQSGLVVGIIPMQDFLQKNSKRDLSYLKKDGLSLADAGAVINGIAYDKNKRIFYITGKLWPEVFAIQLQ
jgi:glutamine cyclotransferase